MPQRQGVDAAMSTIRSGRWSAGLALAGLSGVAGAAWLYLAAGAGLGAATRGMDRARAGMMPMAAGWTPGYAALTLGMWAVMMTAMMLPTAAPAVLRVAAPAARGRGDAGGGAGRAAWFATGYLAVWVGFGAAATGLQWALDSAHLLSDALAVRSSTLVGLVVVAAGVYQLSPFRRACLERCRALDDCLAGQTRHVVREGLCYGVSCLGCCAALMSLLFVGGVMNLVWAAAITVWVLAEKTLPWGGRIARLGADGLLAGGTAALATALVRGYVH